MRLPTWQTGADLSIRAADLHEAFGRIAKTRRQSVKLRASAVILRCEARALHAKTAQLVAQYRRRLGALDEADGTGLAS